MKVCRKKILKKHRDNMKKHAVVDEKGITGQKPRKFSKYFGKCNQATILELSKNMIEVI